MGTVLALAVVAFAGSAATVWCAVRIVRLSRAGAPREQVVGYFGIMLAAALVSFLLVRLVA